MAEVAFLFRPDIDEACIFGDKIFSNLLRVNNTDTLYFRERNENHNKLSTRKFL